MNADNSREKAGASPAWLKKSVMYQVFLRAFTPEGTLKAATDRLAELAEMGIDIIYMCSIFTQDDDMRHEFWSGRQVACGLNNPRNPYRISDYYSIDPEYGTKQDLSDFVSQAHKLGIKVMLDIVYFHCGPTAVFLKEHSEFVKYDENGNFDTGRWNFPQFDFKKPEVCDYLIKILEYWADEFQLDGYRCDVSDLVPLDFWERAKESLKNINPEFIMLAEGSNRKEDQLAAFNLNYNFPVFWNMLQIMNDTKRSVSECRAKHEGTMAQWPQNTIFLNYTDNHDVAHDTGNGVLRHAGMSDEAWKNETNLWGLPEEGLAVDNRHEKHFGFDANDAMLMFVFALDGVPMIYNGQEVADSAMHSIYGNVPVQWEKFNTPEGKERMEFCKKLCQLRHQEQALSEGDLLWLENSSPDSVLSFARIFNNELILAVINLRKKPVDITITLPQDSCTETFDELIARGSQITACNGNDQLSFTIGAYGCWMSKKV